MIGPCGKNLFNKGNYDCLSESKVKFSSPEAVSRQLNNNVASLLKGFAELGEMTDALVVAVAPLAPEHCHIDIQTTDAGPGVGNDLDLQAHFYYAPTVLEILNNIRLSR